MKTTRREAILAAAAGAVTLRTGILHAAETEPSSEEPSPAFAMPPLDYGLSFICNPAPANSVRFWVESRTRIIDDAADTWVDYYQCASCKSEHTFAEKDLFSQDNYDFLPVFGGGFCLVFRRPAHLSDRYRLVKTVEEMWGVPSLRLREAPTVSVLRTWEEIRDVTAAAIPIVTQTTLWNDETGLRAIIECPTKTMNISIDKQVYQVDTGPIAYPDLSKRYEQPIDCLNLAFIAFNAPDFADFVVEQPTPVVVDGEEKAQIYHFSNPFSLPARNTVFALGKL
ncbi:MAG TPA: hypothetical protein PLJ71_21425 [Candidatus Hydrogenedentes bacterium]|nr:hypothetical protein [Candidatus Hydrogenedentota bacterium]HQM51251.1 hypothetical protein [Candidatus Hydrogenedentota bacterium]